MIAGGIGITPIASMFQGLQKGENVVGVKGMPAEAVKRWDEALRQVMQDPAFLKRLQDSGFSPLYEGPEAFARRLESDRRRWREVIQAGKVGQQ